MSELSGSEVYLKLEIKCEAGAQFAVKRKILQIVKEAFDKSGIEIPYQKIVIYQTEKEGWPVCAILKMRSLFLTAMSMIL